MKRLFFLELGVSKWGQVLKYNKSYIIFAAWPGHYGYNFQEQFITSLPEEILYKRSFLILKKLGGDMKSDIARSDPTMYSFIL